MHAKIPRAGRGGASGAGPSGGLAHGRGAAVPDSLAVDGSAPEPQVPGLPRNAALGRHYPQKRARGHREQAATRRKKARSMPLPGGAPAVDIDRLSKGELKERLRDLRLPLKGNKFELLERLRTNRI